jgi:hypothetical protein
METDWHGICVNDKERNRFGTGISQSQADANFSQQWETQSTNTPKLTHKSPSFAQIEKGMSPPFYTSCASNI